MSSGTSTSTIGIDLGTTYSCVGVFQHGKVEIIANDHGNRTTPSYVAFTDTEWFAGEVAKSQSTRNPENTVFNAKRMLGRSYNDREMEADLRHWPFKVTNERGEPRVQVQYKRETKLFSPVEISSMILTKMKMTAEAYLGQKVTDAVITVPAYFNNAQRQATKDAGQIAGLNVKRIINEPTAAALAYGLDKKLKDNKKEMNILIFDLGGGTFDVSVLEVADGVLEVLATRGDTHLGGEDFDHRLAQHFAMEFKRQHKKDIRDNPLALRRLKIACEEVKRALSSSSTGYLEVCGLFEGIDFSGKITRARFDELCGDLFRGTLETVQQALDDAKLDRSQIDEVVLVGGSTRIPKIRKLLEDFFDGKKLNVRINADEAVAYGAAIQAAALSKISVPGSEEQLLLDVVPYSLGVREGEDNFQKLIERNSHVPIRVEREFILGRDYQTAADVLVYEGELPRASDNHLLGQFQLEGLPAKKRGEVKLVIVYDVDADGIMHVTAKDKMSGRSNEITIRCLEYMGSDELKRMQEDAARMEAEARRQEEQLRQDAEEEENGGRRRDGRNDEGRNKPRDVLSSGSERDKSERSERLDEAKRDEMSQPERQETTNRRRASDEDKDERQRTSSDQHQDRESLSRGHDNRSDSSREKDRETTPTRDACRAADRRRSPSSPDRDSSTAQESSRTDSSTDKGRNKSDSPTTQGRRNQPDSSTAQEPVKAEPPPQTAAAAGIASDDILVIIKTLLDGEPSTSREERTKIRQHCVKMLTQLAVSSDPQVRAKCKELRKQLRDKYGNGREASPEKKIRPLRDRARSYLCELVQSLVLIEVGDAQDQVEEVNELCMDMMAWLDEEESATDEEILEKIDELQKLGMNVKGLTMPSDDVIRASVTS